MINFKGHKGITLIALVITIIVLLILAGITIAQITGQDSAQQKAADSKVENERGAAKDAATVLVTEKVQDYYEDKYVKTPATTTATNQLAYIAEKLGSGVTTGDYTVTVTAAGVITVAKGGETLATGTVSTDGVITWESSSEGNSGGQQGGTNLENLPEDSVYKLAKAGAIKKWEKICGYSAGNSDTISNIDLPEGASIVGTKIASISSDYSGTRIINSVTPNEITEWMVLDVDTTKGEVLIMPAQVGQNTFVNLRLEGKDGYNNAIPAINAVAEKYLNPTYATSARSLGLEDVTEGTQSESKDSDSWNHRYGMNLTTLDITDEGEGNTAIQSYRNERRSCTVKSGPWGNIFWLPSRYVHLDKGYVSCFGVYKFSGEVSEGNYIFTAYSDGSSDSGGDEWSVCPVISLKLTVELNKETAYFEDSMMQTATESVTEYQGNIWTIK